MLHSGDEGGMQREAATLDHDVPEIKHQIRPFQPPALGNQVRPRRILKLAKIMKLGSFKCRVYPRSFRSR